MSGPGRSRKGGQMLRLLRTMALLLTATAASFAAQAQPASETPQGAVIIAPDGSQPDIHGAIRQLGRQGEELQRSVQDSLKKLQELQSGLKQNLNDVDTAVQRTDELIAMLTEYRKMIGSDSEAYKLLQQGEAMSQEMAHRAEADADPEIQKSSRFFREDAAKLASIRKDFLEKSTEMVRDMERLGRLKNRMVFTRQLYAMDQFVKNAETYLNIVKDDAERMRAYANGLSTMGQPALTH